MNHSRAIVGLPSPNAVDIIKQASDELSGKAFSVIPGQDLFKALNIQSEPWGSFASSWERLSIDRYMGDKGRYRFRRYGEFRYLAQARSFELVPHGPYVQALDVNPLNGDIERWFDPLEPTFTDSPVLQSVLHAMAEMYNRADGVESDWSVRLHPYRIVSSEDCTGKPTPEGLHRDGVTYIAAMLVSRCNITGGRTRLTSNTGEQITTLELKDPMDLLIADDAKTMHEVSEIRPRNSQDLAYRDVLVIAFTRLAQEEAANKDIHNER